MRSLWIAALAAGLATPVLAEKVVRSGSMELRLLDSTCSHAGTLGLIRPEWGPKFKNARLMKDGKIVHYACWILADENTVFIMYEDGDYLEIPPHMFNEVGA
jgi:hypothetical protein